jgi:Family of unknown function (DUF6527)
MRFRLERVHYMPKLLESGVLYVSDEFGTAAHLCACGCGSKVRTPLGPTEWRIEETPRGPSLFPSVGNWQQPCQSHYWIRRGEVRWAERWTPEEIAAGRQAEEDRRRAYYDALELPRTGTIQTIWRWLKKVSTR